jgi:hypothetical protein
MKNSCTTGLVTKLRRKSRWYLPALVEGTDAECFGESSTWNLKWELTELRRTSNQVAAQ